MPTYGRDAVPLIVRRQSDFNTAQAALAGGFVALPCYPGTNPGSRRDLYDDKRIGEGADPGAMYLGFETGDGPVVAPFDSESVGWHLSLLLGDPVTTGTGPYTHVWKSGGATQWWTGGSTRGGVHFRYTGLAYASMQLQLARASATQRATFQAVLRDEAKIADPLDATPVAPRASDVPFAAFSGVLRVGGVIAADITDLDWTASNNLTPDEAASSGQPYVAQVLQGDFTQQGLARFRFENAARYDLARAGTATDLRLDWTAGADTLRVDIANVKFAADRLPIDSGGALTLSLPWQAAKPDPGDASLTVTLVNTLPSYADPTP